MLREGRTLVGRVTQTDSLVQSVREVAGPTRPLHPGRRVCASVRSVAGYVMSRDVCLTKRSTAGAGRSGPTAGVGRPTQFIRGAILWHGVSRFVTKLTRMC